MSLLFAPKDAATPEKLAVHVRLKKKKPNINIMYAHCKYYTRYISYFLAVFILF